MSSEAVQNIITKTPKGGNKSFGWLFLKTMNIPTTIEIKSDKNVLEFIEEKKGVYRYRYSKSKTKKGLTLEMDEPTLTKLISTNQ